MHTHSEGWQLMLPALVPFGRYRSITPEPTSVSPSYQTANWPGVTPRWGSSKSRYPPSSHTTSSAPLQRLAVTDTHSETPPLPRPHPLGGVDPVQVAGLHEERLAVEPRVRVAFADIDHVLPTSVASTKSDSRRPPIPSPLRWPIV